MNDKIISCYGKSKKLMPFLHLPVQSGSDKILKSMNRKHNIKFYYSIIEKLNPKYFYIENPRAMLRKLDLIPYPHATVTYCQYGFKNMKSG